VPGRCQDGVLDGDQGLEFAYASGQAPVAGAEEGGVLGAVGCHRGNTECAGEPVVAVSSVCGFVSFTGLVESGGDPGPGGEVPGGGEATHVCAGFSDDHFGDVSSDTWDGVEAGEGLTKGLQGRLDASGELGDVRLQGRRGGPGASGKGTRGAARTARSAPGSVRWSWCASGPWPSGPGPAGRVPRR